jgi:hypothetical protein
VAIELIKKGYRNTKVVEGGTGAMFRAGFVLFKDGKLIFPPKKKY